MGFGLRSIAYDCTPCTTMDYVWRRQVVVDEPQMIAQKKLHIENGIPYGVQCMLRRNFCFQFYYVYIG